MDDGVAVECSDLVVRYGSVVAVDGLSLQARHGEVLALLGPNGAGKTSTVETLEGYRRASGGTLRVLGWDPGEPAGHRALVRKVGVMLQRGGVYPAMGPRQALHLFASYYDNANDPDKMLDLLGLGSVARTPWRRLSGGEQQRLSLALALIGRPQVIFLDEPTAGVDPEGRITIRQVISDMRSDGTCVILTTHELSEAERLADDVVIIDHGRAVAHGTVAELAGAGRAAGIAFASQPGIDVAALAAAIGTDAIEVTETSPGRYMVEGESSPTRVAALATWLADRGFAMADLQAGRQSLEEVYLSVTGREAHGKDS
ncbi:MAG: ABC transporter ATP-binding protein [Acidimicrobiales bacterium]